jgi:hypothetical protein
MSSLLYLFYTFIYLALIAWEVFHFQRPRRLGALLLLLITFGLFYDNLILSLGNTLGSGDLLHALSLPRFWLHQIVLPWIILAAFEGARALGLGWAQNRLAWRCALAFSLLVMLLGILTRLVGLRLEPVVLDGVVRYLVVDVNGPPLVSILGIGFVGVLGLLYWIRRGFPWLFLVVVVVFLVEGYPDEALRRAAGSAVEAVLMGLLLWIDRTPSLRRSRAHLPDRSLSHSPGA